LTVADAGWERHRLRTERFTADEPPPPVRDELFELDETIDASLFGIYKFHLFEADDPRVVSTMRAVEQKLWVKTRVGGVARYENDYYHRVSADAAAVPGNPWFICTLWLADYFITRAKTTAELTTAHRAGVGCVVIVGAGVSVGWVRS